MRTPETATGGARGHGTRNPRSKAGRGGGTRRGVGERCSSCCWRRGRGGLVATRRIRRKAMAEEERRRGLEEDERGDRG